ncbi:MULTISPECIES: YcaO-like family protein [Burkholderia]|uniref:Ribosomal protein S12 methylthiotransferase accessory factor n=1 Tax=Burkholderia pyrrocinia TaxID=60550 RepID=A0A318HRK8_BURPY|nr:MULTISPECIES: YcaO-like family protein [Burkholderia]PXX21038.1 ribosomal protein S12 methylthiotransferase accessory factor [Burkholderia pyrrocinia]SFW91073.1 ribosomal protein S12 methylthiotransferase accessory factor [Burkholderia sp. NFACC33-1]SFY46621.1 ribosomal protein S12 methylthiotransferase accessory factor [Burkholderia sp. NFPP32]
MKILVPERAHTLADAEAAIDRYFSDHGITARLDRYGDPLSSTVATLSSTDLVTDKHVGCGKGYADEARVGAKFEAYEHAMGPIGLRAATILANYDEVRAQRAMADVFPMTLLDRASSGIAAIPFADISLINGASLLYPSFLVDYTYSDRPLPGDGLDYTAARRYACGTGLAAGLGFTEAAIHAISEVIERHGIGCLIAQKLFYQLDDPLDFVDRRTVSPALAAVWEDAERVIRASVHLVAVGGEISCPVFIAYCEGRAISGVHVIGGGCSLYASHAALRAIKELVQQYAVADGLEHVARDWARYRRHLIRYPRLLRCMDMRLDCDHPAHVRQITMPTDSAPHDLDAHLIHLQTACRDAGLPVWIRTLHTTESGVELVCAAMPRMERFSIVSLGGHVVPCHRPAQSLAV